MSIKHLGYFLALLKPTYPNSEENFLLVLL